MPAQRRYIIEIPGNPDDPSTDLGKFSSEMETLVGFRPGFSMSIVPYLHELIHFPAAEFVYGEGTHVETERGTQELDGRWFYNAVSPENLRRFEELLQTHGVDYVKDPKFFELCCDETTRTSQSIFTFNYWGEKLLFIAPSAALSVIQAVAYIPQFLPEDERLQRAAIESDNALAESWDAWDIAPPPYTFDVLPSIEAAQKHIDDHVFAKLKETVERKYDDARFNCDVAYTEGNGRRYVYPPGKRLRGKKVNHVFLGDFPAVAKTFSDGCVAVTPNVVASLPLERYFDPNQGIETYGIGACSRCMSTVKARLREKTMNALLESDPYFFGKIADQVGYKFDPTRIALRTKKHRVNVLGRQRKK